MSIKTLDYQNTPFVQIPHRLPRRVRFGAPLLAALLALALQAGLFLAFAEGAPSAKGWFERISGASTAHASALGANNSIANDTIERFGLVVSRPEGKVGSWVISDTTYFTYTAIESTEVAAEIANGDCVRVRSSEATPEVADNIDKRVLTDCQSGDGNDGGDNGGGSEVVHYGLIETRTPHAGIWVISSVSYTVTEATVFVEEHGGLGIGNCVAVTTLEGNPSVAVNIASQEAQKCDGGSDGGGDEDQVNRYGIINERPDVKAGTWVISDTAYTVTEDTIVFGVLNVGDCIQVRVAESAPDVALKLEKKEAIWCSAAGDNNDDDQSGPGGGHEGDEREWEGTIESFPPLLIGEWTITAGEGKKITFVTGLLTRFRPELPGVYAIGRWVEVKAVRQTDGSYLAERVRVDDYEVGEIVVRLESPAYSQTIASKYGIVLTSTLLSNANIYLYRTYNENEQLLVAQLSLDEGVIWAEVNYVNGVPEGEGYKTWGWGGATEPDQYTDQNAYQQIRMGASSRIYQGEGVVVAVLDTGVYTPHEQFAGKLILPSLDVIDDDSDPSDVGPGMGWGHGTHVTGIVAAMAPKAKILPVRVLDENGRGNTFLLAYAIEWASNQPGVKVINLSLGTEFDSRILRDVIARVIERGIVVVAASGNGDTNQLQYPAAYPGVISVTAIDSNSHKAEFANYGSGWVDMAAPGVGIMSTMISAEGPGYASWSGTSMATAFVSGAAALLADKMDTSVVAQAGIIDQIVDTGLVVDALNPLYVGQIGKQLDVSAVLDVDPALVFIPQTQK